MINNLFPEIQILVKKAESNFSFLPEIRLAKLQHFANTIKLESNKTKLLVFICTHNSRRSQLAQIWAQVAAYYYGVKNIKTYSGGTEATAFNPRAVKALEAVGFNISKTGNKNPIYHVKFAEDELAIDCFSKKYDHDANPQRDFIAVMTCSEADENCPVILGAKHKISLPYHDPKLFDDSPLESAKYAERNFEIATEMLYVFNLLKS